MSDDKSKPSPTLTDVDGNVVDLSEFIAEVERSVPAATLHHPPGALGEIVRHYEQRMPNKNSAIACGAVLAGASAAIKNSIAISVLRAKLTPLNIYVVNALPTGAGKESGNDAFAEICSAGKVPLAGEIASGMALQKYLAASQKSENHAYGAPTGVFIDEFGMYLKQARGTMGGWQNHLLRMFVQLFGRGFGILPARPAMGKDRELPEVWRPYLTIYATSTPETLLEGLTAGDITDGTLNRLIVITSDEHAYQEPELTLIRGTDDLEETDLPPRLRRLIEMVGTGVHKEAEPTDPNAATLPGRIILGNKGQATRLIKLHKRLHDNAGETEAEKLGARVWELILRVAGLCTAFDAAQAAYDRGEAYIQESDLVVSDAALEWAEKLVFHNHRWMLDIAMEGIGMPSDLEGICRRLYKHYVKASPRFPDGFVKKAQVMSKVKGGNTDVRKVKEAIEWMKDAEYLQEEERVSPSGQATICWRMTNPDKRIIFEKRPN